MKVLMGTDVLFDAISPDPDPAAELLLGLGAIGEFELYASAAQAVSAIAELRDSGMSLASAHAVMRKLREAVALVPMDEKGFDAVLESEWDDLDSAVLHCAARSIWADAIVTREWKGTRRTRFPVFDCAGFFEWMRSTYGVEYPPAL